MKEASVTQKPPFARRRFHVHPIQRKYFFLSLIPLLLCAGIVAFLIVVSVGMTMLGPAPDLAPSPVAWHIAMLGDGRTWIALFSSIVATGLLSFYVTNKFAGPLYRTERILRQIEDGNLPSTVRFRQDDDLQEFATLLEGAFRTIGSAWAALQAHHACIVKEVAALREAARAPSSEGVLPRLEEIDRHLMDIERVLVTFKIPADQGSTPK